jgi:type II secretion system protein G
MFTWKNRFMRKNNSVKSGAGFTLIELLTVIAIIGLLAAVIFPSFSIAKKKSRVAKRVADMKQVQAALEFYYAANHSYPSTSGNWYGSCSSFGSVTPNNSIPGLAPQYIPVVPTDPQTADPNSCYLYRSDGNDWAFLDYSIPEMSSSQSVPNYTSYPELVDPVRGSGSSGAWKVSSPGGASW